MTEEDKKLRATIATITDSLISERYTEDKVAQRYNEWATGSDSAPSPEATQSYTLAEMRDFSEELLFRVLRELRNK